MPTDPTPIRTLVSFAKTATSDVVTVVVRYSVPVYGSAETFERTHSLSDAALVADATARGATTWDEDDLCAELGAVLPVTT